MRKLNVLFLCTGNSCRSQMAQALLQHRFGDRFAAYSAGMEPKPIHPLTRQVLAEVGIDTHDLRSKSVTEYLGRLWVHFLVVVCQHAQDTCPRIFPGVVERVFWPFEDPAHFEGSDEEKLVQFRKVRDQIDAQLTEWVSQLEAAGKLETVVGGHVG